ncbi:MAG: glycoside hydrolase family 88 protein [Planctomycetota bacterium]|nr:glycoside hydrolase family 88 protein [Planctomycetota bacterium]
MADGTTCQRQVRSGFEFAQAQVRALIERHPDYYPMYTVQGRWKHEGEKWTHWCDGFLPGMMWIFHAHTGDKYWLDNAIRYSTPLEPRQHDRAVHDLGFIFCSTYMRWLNAMDRQGSKTQERQHIEDVLIQAGTTMSLRFKEKGQYLRSFVADESLFVDIMMNVGIIFYEAQKQKERGNAKEAAELFRIADAHCRTSQRYLIRGDGSTAHEAIFDLNTGECLRQTTHQGFRGDSCWSRGLAWALYGFCTVYNCTHDTAYLETSEACARYYIAHTPEHGVPPWDYDAQPMESRQLEDSSAAAIAACGLYGLSLASASFEKRALYRQYFRRIMATLTTDKYLGREPGWEGILKHGVYHVHKKLGVDESVMWGEYFFVEALSKALEDIAP